MKNKTKKFPTLYASNVAIKEIYILERKIDAMGDNISDWQEELYCERPAAPPDDLRREISRGFGDIQKFEKKLARVTAKLTREFGRDQVSGLDYLFSRWQNFGRLTYAEKRKIKVS